MTLRFMYPEFLVMMGVIPILMAGWMVFKLPHLRLKYSQISLFSQIPGAISNLPIWMPRIARISAIFFLIIAAARPQSGEKLEVVYSEGLDIIIALDISGSMRALDFLPENRLAVAKNLISEFISKREHDRIGLVLFATDSFTLCPLTLDHDLLKAFLSEARIGMVEEQTAIGKAIANAVNRLRISEEEHLPRQDKKSESQLVILLTDGVNNVKSKMDPVTAAKAAAALGIKIYTIGVGTNGYVNFPHPQIPGRTVKVQVELDEQMLQQIAQLTGGQYFHALNTEGLKKIFDIIDKLEKVEIESLKYTRYKELFYYPLILALLMFMTEIVIRHSFFRRFP